MEKKSVEEDYISFLGLLKSVVSRRRFVLKVLGIFFLIGIFIAIFSPKDYTSSVKFISQNSASATGGRNLSGLAALVGINLNSSSDTGEIPANIYPKIVNSLPFQRKVMQTKLTFKGVDSAITFQRYYADIAKPDMVSLVKKYTIGLPGLLVKSLSGSGDDQVKEKNDSLIFVNKKEERIRNILKENLIFSIDETDGLISISARMPEPIPSAQLAARAQKLLQDEIIAYRVAKAQDQLDFISKQYDSEKERFETAQSSLAYYQDRNLFNNTQVAQTRLQRLQNEYDLAYSVFSELQRQKVAQEIQIKKDTPIFTTINPATVPNEATSPNRIKILIVSIVFGLFVAVSIVLIKTFLIGFKETWHQVDQPQ